MLSREPMPLDVSYLPIAMAGIAALALLWDLLPAGRAPRRFLRPAVRQARALAPLSPEEVQALHARLQQLEATVMRLRDTGNSIVAQRDAARAEAASLRLALGTAQQELSRVREHREYEGLARAVLQQRPAAPPMPEDGSRFRAAKMAFARLYHPDRASGSELDKAFRGQVFREFWAELERIEKG